jgi:hypothetical protein
MFPDALLGSPKSARADPRLVGWIVAVDAERLPFAFDSIGQPRALVQTRASGGGALIGAVARPGGKRASMIHADPDGVEEIAGV